MKTLLAAQQQAHDRLMASLPVIFHPAKTAEPRQREVSKKAAAVAKSLATRKANRGRTNTWCPPDPTLSNLYVKRDRWDR